MSTALPKKGLIDMESRVIRISSKKQITIPQAFYEKLGLGREAECILKGDELIIRRLDKASDDYSDLILQDLVNQGYTGEELVEQFRKMKAGIRLAAQRMIDDAVAIAKKDTRDRESVHKEIFSDVE
ncbi:MAG: AbrB/MazE/SpoVT family DNA-binding domain-containing protein [Peptococcaceae bacterium]|jgi:bifunctional DNA-binding transcriptional regulator/antitoxin component of YhaV-PrlF toxin-antitoxin module|nr:AbrB/MazE/SpoVT family DNA-binding domain-containing protein [Peptococcaceae bacterium]MDH7525872.1 AbrB/MazE/SpoVT family DNA-binding domain-containing protein [Peptococcaceae bacterium]